MMIVRLVWFGFEGKRRLIVVVIGRWVWLEVLLLLLLEHVGVVVGVVVVVRIHGELVVVVGVHGGGESIVGHLTMRWNQMRWLLLLLLLDVMWRWLHLHVWMMWMVLKVLWMWMMMHWRRRRLLMGMHVMMVVRNAWMKVVLVRMMHVRMVWVGELVGLLLRMGPTGLVAVAEHRMLRLHRY